MHKPFTKEERLTWPEGHKGCNTCRSVLPVDAFNRSTSGLYKYEANCKSCKECEEPVIDSFTAEEIATWPDGHLGCTLCMKVLPLSHFFKNAEAKRGYQYQCKTCVQVDRMYGRAESRARRRGLEFDLEIDDIVIPDTCPVLGIPLVVSLDGLAPGSPSLDRIDNNKGYIKGNTAVISSRANTLKADKTAQEHLAIARRGGETAHEHLAVARWMIAQGL